MQPSVAIPPSSKRIRSFEDGPFILILKYKTIGTALNKVDICKAYAMIWMFLGQCSLVGLKQPAME